MPESSSGKWRLGNLATVLELLPVQSGAKFKFKSFVLQDVAIRGRTWFPADGRSSGHAYKWLKSKFS